MKKQLFLLFLILFIFTCFSCGTFIPNLGVPGSWDDIRLGMTDDAVIGVWGTPMRCYRSVGSWGVREQWRYGFYGISTGAANFKYLYFENGILVSYQN